MTCVLDCSSLSSISTHVLWQRENDSGLSDENDDELAEQGKNMPSASARVAKKLKADLNKKLKTMEKQMVT